MRTAGKPSNEFVAYVIDDHGRCSFRFDERTGMDADRLHPFLYLLIRSHMGSQDVHHVCQLSVRSLEIVVSVFSSGITFRKESDKLVFISCFEITWFFSVRVDLAIIVRNGIAIRDGRDVAKRYQGKSDVNVVLERKIKLGGAGAWGNIPMPPHATIEASDIASLVSWILEGKF